MSPRKQGFEVRGACEHIFFGDCVGISLSILEHRHISCIHIASSPSHLKPSSRHTCIFMSCLISSPFTTPSHHPLNFPARNSIVSTSHPTAHFLDLSQSSHQPPYRELHRGCCSSHESSASRSRLRHGLCWVRRLGRWGCWSLEFRLGCGIASLARVIGGLGWGLTFCGVCWVGGC